MKHYELPAAAYVTDSEETNSPFVVYLNSFFKQKQVKNIGMKTKAKLALEVLQEGVLYPSFDYMYNNRKMYRDFMVYVGLTLTKGLTNALPVAQIVNTIMAYKFPLKYAIQDTPPTKPAAHDDDEAVVYK